MKDVVSCVHIELEIGWCAEKQLRFPPMALVLSALLTKFFVNKNKLTVHVLLLCQNTRFRGNSTDIKDFFPHAVVDVNATPAESSTTPSCRILLEIHRCPEYELSLM